MNKRSGLFALMLFAICNTDGFAEPTSSENPVLNYLGHASLCITVGQKVIYIDPFMGDYDKKADLILVTHQHPDHNKIDLIKNRSRDCKIITEKESLKDGVHQNFKFDFVTVQAVAAGGNRGHNEKNAVGYILTFSNGVTLYVSGDTSKIAQMADLNSLNLDYAFFCCDGIYNMNVEEALECAQIVGAKHNIPYHTKPGEKFDISVAQRFTAKGCIILKPSETLVLKKDF